MSLYNMMNGVTKATFLVMPMLEKHPDEYPRFRDCFLADEEHPEYDNHIHIYTRVGGGNRSSYAEEISEMRAMPGYVTDFDDSFDSTFASFVFEIPERFMDDYSKILSGKLTETSAEYQSALRNVFPKLSDKFAEVFGTEPAG